MKKSTIYKILILLLMTVVFVGCTNDGLTKDERRLIFADDADEIMRTCVIYNEADSLLLRLSARELTPKQINTSTIETLKKRMLATVNYPKNPGVGIAAPQVGVSVRMIYVQRLDKKGEPFEIYYNPVITFQSDSIKPGWEGCLSVPGYRGIVNRSQNIKLTYLDSTGLLKNEKIDGFTAVIFQHEIDHINGILYYDHVENGFEGLVEK